MQRQEVDGEKEIGELSMTLREEVKGHPGGLLAARVNE